MSQWETLRIKPLHPYLKLRISEVVSQERQRNTEIHLGRPDILDLHSKMSEIYLHVGYSQRAVNDTVHKDSTALSQLTQIAQG